MLTPPDLGLHFQVITRRECALGARRLDWIFDCQPVQVPVPGNRIGDLHAVITHTGRVLDQAVEGPDRRVVNREGCSGRR